MGGATGSIGDPSGRSNERPILSARELETNVQGITAQIRNFFAQGEKIAAGLQNNGALRNDEESRQVQIVNNMEWFGGLGLLDFLRSTGKIARVGSMLSKERCVLSSYGLFVPTSVLLLPFCLLLAIDRPWKCCHH